VEPLAEGEKPLPRSDSGYVSVFLQLVPKRLHGMVLDWLESTDPRGKNGGRDGGLTGTVTAVRLGWK
jgi:hypothetical protein